MSKKIFSVITGLILIITGFFLINSLFGVKEANAADSIIIISPNGGENIEIGKTYRIRWNSTISSDQYGISLLKNGTNYLSAMCCNTYSSGENYFDWSVPTGVVISPGSDYKIKVYTASGTQDTSDANFSIFSNLPAVTVTTPNGGENIIKGQNYAIWWDINWFPSNSENKVRIQYRKTFGSNQLGQEIVSGTINQNSAYGYYNWSVPTSLEDGTYRITVTTWGYGTNLSDESNSDFNILSSITTPSITVVSPNGGESWASNQSYEIRWNTSGTVPRVGIFLEDINNYVQTITANITNTGTYLWSLPWTNTTLTSGQYKIRVSGADYSSASDISDSYFNIVSEASTSQCLPDDTLIKLPDDPKVYVIKNCEKEWIETAEEFKQEGYKWEDVKEVNSSVIQAYNNYLEATANLLRAIGQQKVYRVVDGKILWVPTIAAFNAQGLKWEDIQNVSESTVNQYSRLKLVRVKGDPKVYYLTESGLKRWIPTIEVFNSYNNKWEDVVELESKDVNGYSNNDLIKLENEAKVYKLENSKKRWIETMEAFNKLGLDWNKIAPVNQTEFNFYPEGSVIE